MNRIIWKRFYAVAIVAFMLFVAAGESFAQGQGGGHGHGNGNGGGNSASKKEEKKVNKDADKLAGTAEKAAKRLGRDVVFCVLDAHTDVGLDAQGLKTEFSNRSIPFGQFVAAVLMADRTDIPLATILDKLEGADDQPKKSLGQIAREANVSMSDLRKGFGEFRSQLANSMTNPPTSNCFEAAT